MGLMADEGRPRGKTQDTLSLSGSGNAVGSFRKCPGRGKCGCPCSGCCPLQPAQDEEEDGGWKVSCEVAESFITMFAALYSSILCILRIVVGLVFVLF